MVFVDQRGFGRIAPGLGVEMQREDEVGFDRVVDEHRAAADLGGAIEKPFAFLGDGELRGLVAFLAERFDRQLAKPVRAAAGDRLGAGTGQPNLRAEGLQSGLEKFRHTQGHVALDDRLGVADLEPALLHFRPIAADVAGVDRDFQTRKRLAGVLRNRRARAPIARGSSRGGFGEAKQIRRLARRGLDFRHGGRDGDHANRRVFGRVNIREQFNEPLARDGLLELIQLRPIRPVAERRGFREGRMKQPRQTEKDQRRNSHAVFLNAFAPGCYKKDR